jgi:hypothetical protein
MKYELDIINKEDEKLGKKVWKLNKEVMFKIPYSIKEGRYTDKIYKFITKKEDYEECLKEMREIGSELILKYDIKV